MPSLPAAVSSHLNAAIKTGYLCVDPHHSSRAMALSAASARLRARSVSSVTTALSLGLNSEIVIEKFAAGDFVLADEMVSSEASQDERCSRHYLPALLLSLPYRCAPWLIIAMVGTSEADNCCLSDDGAGFVTNATGISIVLSWTVGRALPWRL